MSLYVSFYVVMIYMSKSQNLHLYIFRGTLGAAPQLLLFQTVQDVFNELHGVLANQISLRHEWTMNAVKHGNCPDWAPVAHSHWTARQTGQPIPDTQELKMFRRDCAEKLARPRTHTYTHTHTYTVACRMSLGRDSFVLVHLFCGSSIYPMFYLLQLSAIDGQACHLKVRGATWYANSSAMFINLGNRFHPHWTGLSGVWFPHHIKPQEQFSVHDKVCGSREMSFTLEPGNSAKDSASLPSVLWAVRFRVSCWARNSAQVHMYKSLQVSAMRSWTQMSVRTCKKIPNLVCPVQEVFS